MPTLHICVFISESPKPSYGSQPDSRFLQEAYLSECGKIVSRCPAPQLFFWVPKGLIYSRSCLDSWSLQLNLLLQAHESCNMKTNTCSGSLRILHFSLVFALCPRCCLFTVFTAGGFWLCLHFCHGGGLQELWKTLDTFALISPCPLNSVRSHRLGSIHTLLWEWDKHTASQE